MFRPYSGDAERDDVQYFVGYEVEKTIAHGLKTLFVVNESLQPSEMLTVCRNRDIRHVYLGANQSYNSGLLSYYTNVASILSANDIFVTLDYPVSAIEEVHESGLSEMNYFIAMISVPMPYMSLHSYNTYIKLDDTDFARSNIGVWVHHLGTLLSPESFTHWSAYRNDKPLDEQPKQPTKKRRLLPWQANPKQ